MTNIQLFNVGYRGNWRHGVIIKPMSGVAFDANISGVLSSFPQAQKFTMPPYAIMTVTARM